MQHQLRLSAFHREHYPLLLDWILMKPSCYRGWAVVSVAFDCEQLEKQLANDDVSACLLKDHDEAIGYCEFIREDAQQIRLCRVLIEPGHLRGQGLGKQLLELAIEYAAQQLKARRLALYVFVDNQAAVSLYESLNLKKYREIATSRRPAKPGGSSCAWSVILVRQVMPGIHPHKALFEGLFYV